MTSKKKKIIKFFRNINFIASVVIPFGSLLFFGLWLSDFYLYDTFFGFLTRFIFIAYILPVTVIYSVIVFFNFYPKNIRDGIILFIPFIVFVVAGLGFYSYEDVLDIVVLQAISFYLGLNICFLIGLSYLIYGKFSRNRLQLWKEEFKKLLVFACIIIPAFVPFYYFYALGIDLLEEINAVFFIPEILLVALVYYPKLVKLYFEKKL